MTRKKNAEPCPRCKLIRQEWRRGFGYSQCLLIPGEGVVEVCHDCSRRLTNEWWHKIEHRDESRRFAENEMWSLEPGALT